MCSVLGERHIVLVGLFGPASDVGQHGLLSDSILLIVGPATPGSLAGHEGIDVVEFGKCPCLNSLRV